MTRYYVQSSSPSDLIASLIAMGTIPANTSMHLWADLGRPVTLEDMTILNNALNANNFTPYVGAFQVYTAQETPNTMYLDLQTFQPVNPAECSSDILTGVPALSSWSWLFGGSVDGTIDTITGLPGEIGDLISGVISLVVIMMMMSIMVPMMSSMGSMFQGDTTSTVVQKTAPAVGQAVGSAVGTATKIILLK